MDYTPDQPLTVVFDFESDEQYVAPSALNVIIEFDDESGVLTAITQGLDQVLFGTAKLTSADHKIYANGLNALSIGTAKIHNYVSFVRPSGLFDFKTGAAKLQNLHNYIKPLGRDLSLFGTTNIRSTKAYIKTSAIVSMVFGKPEIYIRETKYLKTTGLVQSIYGNPLVAYAIRYVQHKGIDQALYGLQWVEFNPRYIQPIGYFEEFPQNHIVGGTRYLYPFPLEATKFGSRIIPESQTVYPLGFTGEFGLTEIHNYKQYVKPKGFLTVGDTEALRWGWFKVFNLTSHITQYHIPDDGLNPPIIGVLNQVSNRNRTLQMFGIPHQRFGFQLLYNNARVLEPLGITSPIEQGPSKSMVAYRIRKLTIPGIEPTAISNWSRIHLGARLVKPQGMDALKIGLHKTETNLREYRFISLGEQSLYGKAMISDAIRTLSFESRFTIAPPQIMLPNIKLGQRYIDMLGKDLSSYGGQLQVESRFNKLFPKWVDRSAVGEPIVRNVTPNIKIRSFEHSEFGDATIYLHTRYLETYGQPLTLYGQSRISDSKQYLAPKGIQSFISDKHKVTRLGAGTHVLQYVDFTDKGISADDNLKFIPAPPVGGHKVTSNVIRPEPIDSAKFGATNLQYMGVTFVGYWEKLYGMPTVTNRNRTIQVSPFELEEEKMIGEPRLSPHTIWAVVEAPDQAKLNHPSPRQLHYVDGWDDYTGNPKFPGITCGKPTITHKQRFLRATGLPLTRYGEHSVQLQRFYIEPKGWYATRFGVIGPIGTQYIKFNLPQLMTQYGRPTVGYKPIERDNVLRPFGFDSFKSEKSYVNYYHRIVKPVGLYATQMGTRLVNDTPYTWRGLRVGALMPTIPVGKEQTVFGLARIENWIRGIQPQGENFAQVGEYDPYFFKHRMTVKNKLADPEPLPQNIQMHGLNGFMSGLYNIYPAAHYIRPDGNTDHYRKGGRNDWCGV